MTPDHQINPHCQYAHAKKKTANSAICICCQTTTEWRSVKKIDLWGVNQRSVRRGGKNRRSVSSSDLWPVDAAQELMFTKTRVGTANVIRGHQPDVWQWPAWLLKRWWWGGGLAEGDGPKERKKECSCSDKQRACVWLHNAVRRRPEIVGSLVLTLAVA